MADGLSATIEGGFGCVSGEVADEEGEVFGAAGEKAGAEVVVAELAGVRVGTDGVDVEIDFEDEAGLLLFLRGDCSVGIRVKP